MQEVVSRGSICQGAVQVMVHLVEVALKLSGVWVVTSEVLRQVPD